MEKSKDPNEKSYKLGTNKITASNLIESRFEKFKFHEGSPKLKWCKGEFTLGGKATQVSLLSIYIYNNLLILYKFKIEA